MGVLFFSRDLHLKVHGVYKRIELLLRDEPKLFAQACLELLKNSDLCEQLGLAARTVVIQKYNRDRILYRIQQYINV